MKVLITGAAGQLGRALQALRPPGVELHAASRAELDIADVDAASRLLNSIRPSVVLNAAAYTAVDRAEDDREQAERANSLGPGALASAASERGDCRLIHVSTDYVFDGDSSRAYRTDDLPRPMSVYGQTKLAGDRRVQEVLGHRAVILRTAWLYSAHGKSFLQTMLLLMRRDHCVRVVVDQIGTPTSVRSLASAIWAFAVRPDLTGVFHWTDDGVASRYDFAVAIAEEAACLGLLDRSVRVMPVSTEDFPTAARRPAFSLLDNRVTRAALAIPSHHWRQELRDVLGQVALHGTSAAP